MGKKLKNKMEENLKNKMGGKVKNKIKVKKNQTSGKSLKKSLEKSANNKIEMKVTPLNPMVFYPRFTHIAEKIFAFLDNKSLSNCREVGKSWQECIDNRNLLWIGIVNKVGGNEAFQWACRNGHFPIYSVFFLH